MVRPGACATVGVAEAVDRLQKAVDIGGEVRNRRFGQAPSSGLKRRFGRPHSIPPISLAIDVWQIQAQRWQPMSTRPHFCWPRAKRLQGQIATRSAGRAACGTKWSRLLEGDRCLLMGH